jgi:hypothetical protein
MPDLFAQPIEYNRLTSSIESVNKRGVLVVKAQVGPWKIITRRKNILSLAELIQGVPEVLDLLDPE